MERSKLKDPEWSVEDIEKFYGYTRDVLEDFEKEDDEESGFEISDGTVNRYMVESEMREFLSPKLTASELGITVDSVKSVSDFFESSTKYATPFPQRKIGDSFVVRKARLEDWVRELTGYRGIWRSIPARAKRLIESLEDIYEGEEGCEGEVEPLKDTVYERYSEAVEDIEGSYEDTIPVASAWCTITDEPVSLPHSEHLSLNNHKPLSLSPDRVGWHALLKDSSLKLHTLGSLERFENFKDECERRDLV
jgi:hypothetical protein